MTYIKIGENKAVDKGECIPNKQDVEVTKAMVLEAMWVYETADPLLRTDGGPSSGLVREMIQAAISAQNQG